MAQPSTNQTLQKNLDGLTTAIMQHRGTHTTLDYNRARSLARYRLANVDRAVSKIAREQQLSLTEVEQVRALWLLDPNAAKVLFAQRAPRLQASRVYARDYYHEAKREREKVSTEGVRLIFEA